MSETPSQVGPYVVEREIGRGGMGVVYRAMDSRLGRAVAVKALPDHLSSDPDRLARFEREARTLAQLNHTNIAGIHGLEVHGSSRFLVLEFVEGETLADRMERGPIAVDDALELAVQIADALEAAHEKGVVHRDLKPGNVMVTPDGVAKVLDFGLARTSDNPPSSSGHGAMSQDSPTITSPMPIHSPTIPGAIMGSAGYMSPEQARGRSVDKRSDIFSFGCVLYEMLTGARPFVGDTVADVLGATLHKDLDLSLLPANTPLRVRELLASCLAKDRRNRLHDIGDARIALQRALDGREWLEQDTTVGQAATRRSSWAFAAVCAVIAAALLVGGWFVGVRSQPAPAAAPTIRMLIPSATAQYTRAGNSVISPDGQSVVFAGRSKADNRWQLWVRKLDSFDAQPIAETEGAGRAFWSWDSRSIAFSSDGKLWSIDLEAGGGKRLLAAVQRINGAEWGPKGDILFCNAVAGSTIQRIAPGTSEPQPVTSIQADSKTGFHMFPKFLPDGNRFLFTAIDVDPNQEVRTGRLMLGRLDSPEVVELCPMLAAAWYAEPGWLVYVEDGAIRALPFDQQAGRITGAPITIGDNAFYFKAFGASTMTVSNGGIILFEPPSAEDQLTWLGPDGASLGTLGPTGSFTGVRLSPDGARAVVGVTDRRTGGSDLWIYGVERATQMRLTSDARWEGVPAWSADGATVYFSSDRFDAPWIFSIGADGSDAFKEVYGRESGGSVWFCADSSPDGSSLLVQGNVDRLGTDLRVIGLKGAGEARPFQSSAAAEFAGRFSPDGKWIAFVSDRSGQNEIYIAPSDGPGRAVQASVGGGWNPRWDPSGAMLYFLGRASGSDADKASETGSTVMAIDLASPEAFRMPPPPRVQFKTFQSIEEFEIAPDGKRFLAVVSPADTPMMRVILNGLPPKSSN